MNLEIKDHVIVVTGGASGIGEAITRACLNEGAIVAIVSRTTRAVEIFLKELKQQNFSCTFIETELGDIDQCRSAIDVIVQKHGRIDGLVNNAGVNDSIGLADGNPSRFMESLHQNLLHYYAMAHYALPYLKVSSGSIVNISSKVALTGQGNTSAYAAAKGAQLALTREWAAELAPFGIRVNSVLPAEVLTPLYESWLNTLDSRSATLDQISARIPLGHRMTKAVEIAAMVVFLLSAKQSGHTTAQQILVDGGYTHLDRALT
jgi:L-fucose dehydrogenase